MTLSANNTHVYNLGYTTYIPASNHETSSWMPWKNPPGTKYICTGVTIFAALLFASSISAVDIVYKTPTNREFCK